MYLPSPQKVKVTQKNEQKMTESRYPVADQQKKEVKANSMLRVLDIMSRS
jgi:hypothetical protein